jgi:hypothetical protein
MGKSEKQGTQKNPLLAKGMRLAMDAKANVQAVAVSVKTRVMKRPLFAGLAIAAVVVVAAGITLAVTGLPDWQAIDVAKETVGAKQSIAELTAEVKKNPKNATAWVELGHMQFEAGLRGPALGSYDRGLGIDQSLASDRVITNLISCYGKKEQAAAQAIVVLYKLVQAEDALDDLIDNKQWVIRNGAIVTLEKLGKAERDDYLTVYTLDLQHPECDVKREAVEKLGGLGDKRALQAIRTAKKKEDETTPWYAISCIGDRAADAEKQILARK